MSPEKIRKEVRQDYQRLREEAAAALVRLGVDVFDAWEAVKAAERTKDGRIAMAIHSTRSDNRGPR